MESRVWRGERDGFGFEEVREFGDDGGELEAGYVGVAWGGPAGVGDVTPGRGSGRDVDECGGLCVFGVAAELVGGSDGSVGF